MGHYEFLSYPNELVEPLYVEGKKKATELLANTGVKEVDAVMFKDGSNSTAGLLVETDEGKFFYPMIEEGDGADIEDAIFVVIDDKVINGNVTPPIPSSLAEEAFNMFHVAKVL